VASKAWLSDLPPAVEKRMRRLAAETTPSATGPDPRLHRALPAPYLKRFAADDDQIVVVRTDGPTESRLTEVRNAALVEGFYPSDEVDGKAAAAAERAFALIDQAARQPLARLARAEPFPPSKGDRATLALWLAALSVRGPRREPVDGSPLDRASLAAVVDRASAAELLERIDRPADDRAADAFAVLARFIDVWAGAAEAAGPAASGVAAPLEAALALEQHFMDRFWTLLQFPDAGLVTCDRPFKVFRGGDGWPDTGPALVTADEIWFPIDRSAAVIFHSNTVVGEKATQPPANFPVDKFNQEVISNSHHEIYCHPADFERVAQLQLAPNRKMVP
jgi:hypothetical protein